MLCRIRSNKLANGDTLTQSEHSLKQKNIFIGSQLLSQVIFTNKFFFVRLLLSRCNRLFRLFHCNSENCSMFCVKNFAQNRSHLNIQFSSCLAAVLKHMRANVSSFDSARRPKVILFNDKVYTKDKFSVHQYQCIKCQSWFNLQVQTTLIKFTC